MIKDEEEMDFLDIFGQLDDPRIERKKLHPMPEILLLTLCAVICGADSWDDIEMFGKSKLMFLRQYLPYESGVPSDDTLRRFFRALDTTSSNAFLSNGLMNGSALKWQAKWWRLMAKRYVVAMIADSHPYTWCPPLPAKRESS